MHLRVSIPLLALCFSALTIQAKGPGNVRPQFHFPVTSIIGQNGDTCFATLRGGSNQGLFEGAVGQWLRRSEQAGFQAEGLAWVKKLYPTHAIIALIHDDFEANEVQLEDLGQVRLTVNVPKREYRGIFFDLVKQGVKLNSLNGDPLIDPKEILELESQELERMILDDFVDESQLIGQEMPFHMDDPMVESGLFTDQRLFGVMEEISPRTVRSFLRFMASRPDIYGIEEWNFGEVFATWITQGTPHTNNDLEGILTASTNDREFYQNLSFFEPVIEAATIDQWNMAALGLAQEDAFEDAVALNKIATEAAYQLEDAEQIGWSHYYSASIVGTQEQMEAENEQFALAVKWFDIAQNEPAKSLAQSRLGANLLEMGNLRPARKQLKRAIRTGQLAYANKESDAVRSIISRSLIFLGLSHEALKKPKRAIKAYKYALVHLEEEQNEDVQERRALIYNLLAEANSKAGNTREATSWRKKSEDLK